jgi:hypothetical protein
MNPMNLCFREPFHFRFTITGPKRSRRSYNDCKGPMSTKVEEK